MQHSGKHLHEELGAAYRLCLFLQRQDRYSRRLCAGVFACRWRGWACRSRYWHQPGRLHCQSGAAFGTDNGSISRTFLLPEQQQYSVWRTWIPVACAHNTECGESGRWDGELPQQRRCCSRRQAAAPGYADPYLSGRAPEVNFYNFGIQRL